MTKYQWALQEISLPSRVLHCCSHHLYPPPSSYLCNHPTVVLLMDLPILHHTH